MNPACCAAADGIIFKDEKKERNAPARSKRLISAKQEKLPDKKEDVTTNPA